MTAKIPPKPAKDVIYVDVDDEITSIIDKVENSEQKVVALVLPKRTASLQSIVNMKLLKRSADAADKSPVLITSEAALIPLAGAAGLHVAKNLQSKPEVPESPAPRHAVAEAESPDEAEELPDDTDEQDLPQKIDYSSSIGALAAAHDSDNPETIDLDEDEAESKAVPKPAKKSKELKNKVPNFDRFRMMLGLGALAFIALIVFLIMAVTVLPKATITIKTSSEPVSANFSLVASADTQTLDTAKGVIPAKLESADQTGSQQVTATGQQNNGDKATGSVTLSNCTNSPVTIPAGTGVSSGSATFIIQSKLSLDSGNFTSGGTCKGTGSHVGSANITAQSAGSKYNVSSGSFSVAGYSGVSGSGSTSGGSDNIVTVLSQADIDGAKSKLTSASGADQFTKDLQKKLTAQGEYVLSSTLKAGEPNINASPAVGQPASTANVTIKITYTVLTVKKSDLSKAIEDKTASQVDKSKQRLNGNFLQDANITVAGQNSPNSANLTVNEDTTAVPIIDTATVKKQSKGKKAGDIKSAIGNWGGVKDVDVKLSPFWVSKVPSKDSKIKVVLVEVKSSDSNNSAP